MDNNLDPMICAPRRAMHEFDLSALVVLGSRDGRRTRSRCLRSHCQSAVVAARIRGQAARVDDYFASGLRRVHGRVGTISTDYVAAYNTV